MTRLPRRTVLKGSAAAVGGLLTGPTIVGASSSEDRYIVDTKGVSQSELDGADVEVIHDLDEVNLAVVRGTESDVEDIGGDFAADTTYELGLPFGEPAGEKETTDEPLYRYQWDKKVQDIGEAHDVSRGEGARVAVIDSGVDWRHPDLAHAVNDDLSANFTDDGGFAGTVFGDPIPDYADVQYHGTHVSGILAANDENDFRLVGSAPATDLVACRIFPKGEPHVFDFGDMIAAVVYSVNVGCDVANLSLSAYFPRSPAVMQFYGETLNRVVNYANGHGTLLVGAAGNQGADLQHDPGAIHLPSESPNVMSVSATGPLGFNWDADGEGDEPELEEPSWTPAEYTNYGTNVINVSAPGGRFNGSFFDSVLSTIPRWLFGGENEFLTAWLTGTSMAAPQVTGAAALVKSVDSSPNPNQLRTTLERTAADKGKKGKDPYHGSGFVDPVAAVEDARKKGNGKGKGN